MTHDLSLSIFFPAYNEEANIEESVKAAETAVQKLTKTYEIIVVDDGSRDNTGALIDKLAKTNPHIRAIHHEKNKGYGSAVWTGLKNAQYEYIFFTDADLQFDLEELKQLVQYVPEYEVVIGYRAKRQDPFVRLLNAAGWNYLNRLLFGLKVKDIDCAFKLFHRSVIETLDVKSGGAMFSAELLIRLQRQGIPFKEVAVSHHPRKKGSPTGAKPSVIVRAFREMIQVYRGDLGNVTQRQAMKFTAVGASNTILDLAIYIALTRLFPFFGHYKVGAKAISFFLASLSSFFINRRWTFKQTHPLAWSEFVRFYAVAGVALLINAGALSIFLRFIRYDILAVIASAAVSYIWNFLGTKFWVFRAKATPPQPA